MRRDPRIDKITSAIRRMNGRITANQNNDKYERMRTQFEIKLIYACLAIQGLAFLILIFLEGS